MKFEIFEGSFSAVSAPKFASKYSLESSWRDLQDKHTFAPLQTQNYQNLHAPLFSCDHNSAVKAEHRNAIAGSTW